MRTEEEIREEKINDTFSFAKEIGIGYFSIKFRQ